MKRYQNLVVPSYQLIATRQNQNVYVQLQQLFSTKLKIFVILLHIITTLTNSEGIIFTYTNEFIETILLQLNSSNNYYTTGDDDVLFIKIGSNKVLVLDYTYHINRNIFQNYTTNEDLVNNYDL